MDTTSAWLPEGSPLPERSSGLDCVMAGEALIAFIADPGVPLREAHGYGRHVVGSELNVAVGLSRLGHQSGLWCRLPTDDLGQAAARFLRQEGIAASIQWDRERTMGILVRDAMPDGDTRVVYQRSDSAGSRLDASSGIPHDWARSRFLFATGISAVVHASLASAQLALATAVVSSGGTLVLDPNHRRRLGSPEDLASALAPLLPMATYILGSPAELQAMTRMPDTDAAVDELLDLPNIAALVVKQGRQGSTLVTRHGRVDIAPHPVRSSDPVGAGDAFAAGFISGLLKGAGLEEAARLGSLCGASVVRCAGDTVGLPWRDQLPSLASWEMDR